MISAREICRRNHTCILSVILYWLLSSAVSDITFKKVFTTAGGKKRTLCESYRFGNRLRHVLFVVTNQRPWTCSLLVHRVCLAAMSMTWQEKPPNNVCKSHIVCRSKRDIISALSRRDLVQGARYKGYKKDVMSKVAFTLYFVLNHEQLIRQTLTRPKVITTFSLTIHKINGMHQMQFLSSRHS